LIASLYGPVQGRRHDAGILAESGFMDEMRAYAPNYVFGDKAYPLRAQLIVPFKIMIRLRLKTSASMPREQPENLNLKRTNDLLNRSGIPEGNLEWSKKRLTSVQIRQWNTYQVRQPQYFLRK